MVGVFVALAVLAWAATIVAALLRRGSGGLRPDTDSVPYWDIGSPRSLVAFWLSIFGPTVGLVATLLVFASRY